MCVVASLLLCLVMTTLIGASPNQAAPCETGEPPTGCVDLTLLPDTLTADLYVDDVLAASNVNSGRLLVPAATTARIEARNVRDSSEGFGDLFGYQDASTSVWVAAGRVRNVTLRPRKLFIKGFLTLTCDVRNAKEGEDVACRPIIDGANQPPVSPGEKATYNLEPGEHAIQVEVVGQQADLWSPAVNEHTVNIRVGATRTVQSTFNKKGLLTIALDQEGVVGDLYLDEELVARQVAMAQVWVAPNTSHRVEGRDFHDPAAEGEYQWKDATSTAYLGAGQERTTTLRLQKEFLVGYANVQCQAFRALAEDDVACNVRIDEKNLGTVQAGQRETFTLPLGDHNVIVALSGSSAGKWESTTTLATTTRPGQTSYLTARFNLLPPTPTPIPPPARTGNVVISYVRADGVVPRVESDEYAVITNRDFMPINLQGWRLNAGDQGQNFRFPDYVLAPGQSCRVYTNESHPETCGFSFGSGRAIWNNRGDTGYLYDSSGAEVSRYSYGSGG